MYFFQVCFELVDLVTIKTIVDNVASSYANTAEIPEWTKPEQTEYVPGISIWIDEAKALRKYEFQVDKAPNYVPISGYEMTDVRSVAFIDQAKCYQSR